MERFHQFDIAIWNHQRLRLLGFFQVTWPSFTIHQFIGLKDKLQENPAFHRKIPLFSSRFSLKSTHWIHLPGIVDGGFSELGNFAFLTRSTCQTLKDFIVGWSLGSWIEISTRPGRPCTERTGQSACFMGKLWNITMFHGKTPEHIHVSIWKLSISTGPCFKFASC